LKILEGTSATMPVQGGRKHPHQKNIDIDTTQILFICGGSFEGLENIIKSRLQTRHIGFNADIFSSEKKREKDKILRQVLPEDLIRFGLIPELVGRLTIIATVEDLDRNALMDILIKPKNALTLQYKQIFQNQGVELKFTQSALEAVVEKDISRNTGARGLRSIIEESMLDIMYEIPSHKNIKECTITDKVIKNNEMPIAIREKEKKQIKETA